MGYANPINTSILSLYAVLIIYNYYLQNSGILSSDIPVFYIANIIPKQSHVTVTIADTDLLW